MSFRSHASLVALSLGLCLARSSTVAHAEGKASSAAAEALVDDASKAYKRKEYRKAADLFEQAHAKDPVPSLLVNAAQAWRLGGELGRAADDYAAALSTPSGDGGLSATDRSFVQRQLDDLSKSVATVSIDEPRGGTVSVAHVHDAPVPLVVHLAPGQHEVSARDKGGATVKKTLEVHGGETRTVSFVAESASPGAPPAAPATGAQPHEAPTVHPSDDKVAKRSTSPVQIAGGVTLGAGVVLGAVTAYLGVRTLSAVDDWDQSHLTDLDAHDKAVTLKTATNVTLAFACAASAAGVLMIVIPIAGPREPHGARLVVTPGAASVRAAF